MVATPRVRVLDTRYGTLEQHVVPPGGPRSLPPHVHEDFQIGLNIRSPGRYRYRGTVFGAQPGNLFVFQPHEVHEASGLVAASHRVGLNAYFRRAAVQGIADQIWRAPAGAHFAAPIYDSPGAARRFRAMFAALAGAGATLEQDGLVLDFVSHLLLRHSRRDEPRALPRAAIGRARDYLEDRFAEPVALEDLAALAGLSPYHFARTFREQVGLPPHAYQTQVRIARAKALLAQGQSIAGAAAAAGFCDQAHFTHHFARIVGVTPGRYGPLPH